MTTCRNGPAGINNGPTILFFTAAPAALPRSNNRGNKNMRRLAIIAAFVAVPATTAPVLAQQNDTSWEIATGADYSAGEYGGTSDTTVFAVPFSLKMTADRLRVELGVSYLNLEGPGAFAGGPGTPVIVDPGIEDVTTRSGIGDTTVGGAFALFRTDDRASAIEAAGTVKLPTAKSGLGTGKTDFTTQLNFYYTMSPRFLLTGSAGYQWLGDFRNFGLKDGFLGNVGMNAWPNQTTAIGGALSFRQEPWEGIGEQVSISPYVLWRFDENWGVTGYGTVGLTEASPRFGTGLRLTAYR